MAERSGRTLTNKAKAVPFYRQAADQGNAKAQLTLSMLYMNGDGVPKDLDKAYKWSELAVGKGGKRALIIQNRVLKKMYRSLRTSMVKLTEMIKEFSEKEHKKQ